MEEVVTIYYPLVSWAGHLLEVVFAPCVRTGMAYSTTWKQHSKFLYITVHRVVDFLVWMAACSSTQ